MRLFTLASLPCTALLLVLLASVAAATAAPPLSPRRVVPFGREPDAPAPAKVQRERPAAAKTTEDTASTNYIVTLDRAVSNAAKDKILDKLMSLNVVVKTVFDYRVYKGLLISVPPKVALADWQSPLLSMPGVKYVEADQLVTTQAAGKGA